MEYRDLTIRDHSAIIDVWNNNIGTMFPMDERLFKQNMQCEKNSLHMLGAFYGDELAGFIIFKQWTTNTGMMEYHNIVGYINSIVVDIKYRKNGVGGKLLEMAEEKLKSMGVETIKIGQDTFHFFPGIPSNFVGFEKTLIKRGYEIGNSHYDMICDISKVNLDKIPGLKLNTNNEYSIGLYEPEEEEELYNFLKKSFPGRWFGDKILFLDNGMEPRDLVLVRHGKRIIGFCHIYDNKSKFLGSPVYWRELLGDNYGGLGPIGIDPDYRKQDLGLTLLYKSLEILKVRGIRKMVIDWTQLVDFYGIFNFLPWKEYKAALKKI